MKYIKTYEKFNIEIGDLVVLLRSDFLDRKNGFQEGEIYKINFIDDKPNVFPYQIISDKGKTHVSRNQIRKTRSEEIKDYELKKTTQKYNL